MKRDVYINLLISICSLLVCAVVGELGIRYLGFYDPDGNFIIRSRMLKAYHPPAVTTKKKIDDYLSSSSKTVLLYDSLLGWTPRPNGKSKDGLYNYNSFGVRSAPFEYPISPPQGVLRIAIFGDSFTHGDEVPFENTWGYYLKDNLNEANIDAEVINFGVGGYGMDQAFLRWKEHGHKFSPHIVIFGLQMVDVNRNVNIIRPLSNRWTNIPFSKPRFILTGEGLKLINVPTIPLKEIPNVLENIETWDLARYEYHFNSGDYQDHMWLRSKLISLALGLTSSDKVSEQSFYSLDEEPALLTLRIIQEFKKDVELNGGRFLIVYLPIKGDLTNLLNGEELAYSELLEKIEEDNNVIHPENEFLERVESSSLDIFFMKGGHYSSEGNKIIADRITKSIVEMELGVRP